MMEAFPANGPANAFDIGSLPARPGRWQHFLDPPSPDAPREIGAEDAVGIPQQVARDSVKREGLEQLLAGPAGGWMSGAIELENSPAIVSEHQEHVEDLEADRGHREEIDRDE